MHKKIDPKEFGIRGKTIIEKTGGNTYAIVIDRRSRIIMSDGVKILEKAEKIRALMTGASVQLLTTSPVCSKTRGFLKKHGIIVESV